VTVPWIGEAVRFGTVGLLQNGLNVATFALLAELGMHYRPAAVLAALLALLVSFLLNRRWTFLGRATPVGAQAVRYVLVFAAAVALGVVLLTLFVEAAGAAEVPAQVAAIVIVAPLSFLVQRTWVFRAPPRSAGPRG
jgi:putative flippase GtrA